MPYLLLKDLPRYECLLEAAKEFPDLDPSAAEAFLHLPQPQWLTDDDLKLASILLVDVWMWTPFMMLISLAGLNAIPKYIYEAAEIDRAGRWMVFRTITLPMCAPCTYSFCNGTRAICSGTTCSANNVKKMMSLPLNRTQARA